MNWNEAQTLMESARDKSKGKPIARNTRLWEKKHKTSHGGCGYEIRLHGNLIMDIYPNFVVLYDGGWRTVTTKSRLNQFSPAYVYQRDFVWYIGGTDEPFINGMVIGYE